MNRVLPGLLMAAAWLLLSLGPVALMGLVLLAATGLGLYEYFRMTAPALGGSLRAFCMACAALPALAAFGGQPQMLLLGLLAALFGLLLMGLNLYGREEELMELLGSGALAVLYIGLCSACLLLLNAAPHRSLWLILLAAITAGSDTGAYYAGRRFGKRKVFPRISPKKTLAGVIGGLICGVAAALLVHALFRGPMGFAALAAAAALLVLAGITGDLAESMIKRCCGVKDSGTLLAGHGGVLDRIDSMLLAGPLLYALLFWQGLL